MAALFLSGVLAYHYLPIAALPQIDYPTIQVRLSGSHVPGGHGSA